MMEFSCSLWGLLMLGLRPCTGLARPLQRGGPLHEQLRMPRHRMETLLHEWKRGGVGVLFPNRALC